jgi:iron complex transport system substrate-binding protein
VALVVFAAIVTVHARGGQAAAPRRVISLVPAVTEMLFAMGAGQQVAAVSSYDTYPPEALTRPKVGALVDPDFERILSLKPDLVIVYATQAELIARLERLHIPVFHYQHAGMADITETVRAVGARVGRADEAERLAATMERDVARVRAAVAGRRRPRTILLFGREPGTLRSMYASGGIGFLHDMLDAAGGDDALADVQGQNLQLSTEVLLARAPEVILEVHPSSDKWPAPRLAAELAVWQALPALPAVKAHRIYILADDRFVIPGPRVAEAVRLMAEVLHPDAFTRTPGDPR